MNGYEHYLNKKHRVTDAYEECASASNGHIEPTRIDEKPEWTPGLVGAHFRQSRRAPLVAIRGVIRREVSRTSARIDV